MEFGLSTHWFVDERLSSHILDRILAAGVSQIELFAARQHFDYHDPNHIRDVAQWFEDHEVKLYSLHAPLYADFDWGQSGGPALSVAYLEKRRRIDSMEEFKRALEVAERLPFRYLVLHLGLTDEEYDLAKFDAAFTSIEHLKIFAKERGVQVLLENIPNELSTPERLLQFIHYTRMEDLQICFDIGHAHMTCGVHSAFQTLKDRIASAHVHDNHREKDDHLLPFDGEIDWQEAVRDFRALGRQFPLVLELRQHGSEVTNFVRLREAMERIESIR
jgi:sugar phosphate isomerase/epimerase